MVQAVDWLTVVPAKVAFRPSAKLPWLLVRSEPVPQTPVVRFWEHALVVTETVVPVVLTEIPDAAPAVPAVRARGRAAAAVTVRPERSSS